MSTAPTGEVAVEVTPEPETTAVEIVSERGLVRARVGAGGVSTTLVLEPEEAAALGEELVDAADRAE